MRIVIFQRIPYVNYNGIPHGNPKKIMVLEVIFISRSAYRCYPDLDKTIEKKIENSFSMPESPLQQISAFFP